MSYKLPTNEHGTSDGQQLTIDIRPLLEDVSQVMTKHISSILSGVVGEYTVYKETHDTIMGLPCVRKLQERISDLENQLNGSGPVPAASSAPASAASSSTSTSVPPAVSELQSAIVELNRYIQVLESRVDVKNAAAQQQAQEQAQEQPEEAIRLEVHENDVDEADADADADADDADESETVIPPSVHTNRIVESSSTAVEAEAEDVAEDVATDEDEDEAAAEAEAEEEAAAEAEDVATDEAEEEAAAEAEEAEEEAAPEAEEEAAPEAEEEAAPAEESEAEDVATDEDEAAAEAEEDEAAAEAEEEEIEVSEIKIKGVTYFTTNAQNGIIYSCVDDDVGDEVGVFKNGVALFSKNKAATKK
jgi:chemotaxis protein histidine kinase CheA